MTLDEQVAEIRRLCREVIMAHPFTKLIQRLLGWLARRLVR